MDEDAATNAVRVMSKATSVVSQIERDRAIECLMHQVAAEFHRLLAETGLTVDDLKKRLHEYHGNRLEFVDDVLAAKCGYITLDLLSDMAHVIGAEFDTKIRLRMVASQSPA